MLWISLGVLDACDELNGCMNREPGDSTTFCLRAPLQGTTGVPSTVVIIARFQVHASLIMDLWRCAGVDLQPRIWVSVQPNPAARAVTFSRHAGWVS